VGGLSCKVLVGNSDVAFHHIARGAVGISLPTGELTDHIGIAEAKLPKEIHLSNVVIFPRKSAKKPRENAGPFFYLPSPERRPVILFAKRMEARLFRKALPKVLGLGAITEPPPWP
jgi:hypothetical protein